MSCDVGIEYKFVDNTSFIPQIVFPQNEILSTTNNDVDSDLDVKVCLSQVGSSEECTHLIGTAHVIYPEHTTDDIPLSSQEKATDEPLCGEVSNQTAAENQLGTDANVGNDSEETTAFSDNDVELRDSIEKPRSVSPLPQSVSQIGDSMESAESVSPVNNNVTDHEVNIAVENSATVSDGKQLDLASESVVNDVEVSECTHPESSEGTGNSAKPLMPQNEEASNVKNTNLDSNSTIENKQDGTAGIPLVLPNISANMEETEASKSTKTEDKTG